MTVNTQFTVENRRNWKGQVFDYDAIQAYEFRECQYCLTDAQVAVLGGIIESLGWATRWQSNTQEIDPSWVRDFKNDIARRLMMDCCGDDVIYSYDSDGNLEKSEDGGVTYNPDPQDDIRINPKVTFPVPPTVEGQDLKCIAADGAIKLIKDGITSQLTDGMSRYTLSQLISDWTNTLIGTSNPFEALATIVSNQIFALVISSVIAALTDDVYNKLECILYCNMDETAFFSGDTWATVRSDILSQITGVAGVFLEHLVYLLGNGGLSNLARSGAGNTDADCTSCDCGFCAPHFDLWDDTHGIILSRTNEYIEVQGTNPGNGNYYAILKTPGQDICCQVLMVEEIIGTIELHLYTPCGQPQVIGVPATGGTHFNGCLNYIQAQSTNPFTAKIYFADC